jgi:hypothetical protein
MTLAILYLVAYLVLRLTMAWTVGVWGVGDDLLRRRLWLIPLRDAIYLFVWLASFTSKRIAGRGKEYTTGEGADGAQRQRQSCSPSSLRSG